MKFLERLAESAVPILMAFALACGVVLSLQAVTSCNARNTEAQEQAKTECVKATKDACQCDFHCSFDTSSTAKRMPR